MERTKTIASDELLMEQLQNQAWEETWLRLTARCVWLLRNRYSVNWSKHEIMEFSREVISEVIDKIFIGKERKWNIDRYPDFENFIVGVIDSHVNNTLNKKKKEFAIGDGEYNFDEKRNFEANAYDNMATEELRNKIFKKLETAGADDDELMIFECLADGVEKPEGIKKELGISDSHFHNAWRRFKRKRGLIQKILAADGY